MKKNKEHSRCVWCHFFNSSLGQKFIVGGAGLLLCGFLLTHLAGNLLLFVGEGAFNHYAETLAKNPLLPVAEIALALLFVLHIVTAIKVRLHNASARPIAYESYGEKGGRTPMSKTMTYTAALVFVFLIVHLKNFRFGDDKDGLFRLVADSFKNPALAAFYVAAMLGLGLHLGHGFQSAFQTFGLHHPKYRRYIKRFGYAFAALVTIGFASMPLYFLLGK